MIHLGQCHKKQTGDPWWSKVTLLLPMTGDDASTTFTDSSSIGHTVTAVGDAQVDDGITLFSNNTLLLDGAGDCLSIPAHTGFDFGTGAFTIECFFETDSFPGDAHIYARASGTWGIVRESTLSIISTTKFRFYWGIRGTNQDWIDFVVPTMSVNTWYHVAVCRNAVGVWSLFLNGVKSATTRTTTIDLNGSTLLLRIGAANLGTVDYEFAGHIANFRITKGVARYTANFDPPTAAFPTS